MNTYEITLIVRPDLDDEQARNVTDGVLERLTRAGGEIVASYPWSPPRRRMAYPIRDFGDGYYFTADFQVDPQQLTGLENALKLNDSILRFLVVQATDLMVKGAQQRMQHQAAAAAAPPQPVQPAAPPPQAGPASQAPPAPQPAPAVQPSPVPPVAPAEVEAVTVPPVAPEAEAVGDVETAVEEPAEPAVIVAGETPVESEE